MNPFEAMAERIIRLEGLTFVLASKVGNEVDLRQARDMLKRAIMKALADAAVVQDQNYKAFAHELINSDGGWCSDWDGGSIQDLAVKHGILREVAYDPNVHGPNDIEAEPGDPWFVFVAVP